MVSSKRLYKIVKTFLQFGLDELVPKKYLPWYVKIVARFIILACETSIEDKTKAQRVRLAIESLGPVFM